MTTLSLSTIAQNIIIWAPGILFAITLHEWAHGFAASLFGDDTAKKMGRLTLNPLPHIDPLWTLLIPTLLLLGSMATVGHPFVFGKAKPVPIDFRKLKGSGHSFRMALFWVAAAGPLMNLLLATVCGLLFHAVVHLPAYFMAPLANMLVAAIQMNVLLAVFNLLPIPPLDGGRMATAVLPPPWDYKLAAIERFGLPIVIVLAMTDLLGRIIGPVMVFLNKFFVGLTGII